MDYITKPFMKEAVIARVNVHIKLCKATRELESMTVSDELTGAYNRRFAYRMLSRQIKISLRDRNPFVVGYVDIDYDPFFTTKEVALGLATVYGIVTEHGGHILCDSEPGQGATFKIYWPANQETVAPTVQRPSKVSPPRKGTETLLVVDDAVDIRNLLMKILESNGYTVIAVKSGEQALAVYAEKGRSIHMVILDIGMPGMGGRECLQKLVHMDPSVRVLIHSGYSAAGQAREILQAGALGFIGKPYKVNEILAKVRETLERSSHSGDKREN